MTIPDSVAALLPTRPITAIETSLTQEECFTHIDDVAPFKQTTFAAARLVKFCVDSNQPLFQIPITKDQADFCIANRGVEAHRLKRLRPVDLEKPLLFVRWDSDNHLLVDGTHRLVRLVSLGIFECLAYIIEEREIWEKFVVVGIPQMDPDALLRSDSGL